MFSREDWTLFRNLGTLSQKAGVPLSKIRRLTLKELVDNALDAAGGVEFARAGPDAYWVQDDGPGIPGDAEAIARMFSVNRPLTSTKILRLPVRGALGNGLRVVVGAVLSTGGSLEVATGGRRYKLRPRDSDGGTDIVEESDWPSGGTRVTVRFGKGLPADPDELLWAKLAKLFSFAKTYQGKTSAWWYDSDSFFELLMAAGSRPVTDLVAAFDGYGPDKKETPPAEALGDDPDGPCEGYTREEAEYLLQRLREGRPPVKPDHIGCVGASQGDAYHKVKGVLTVKPGRGKTPAELPFVVEVWAVAKDGDDDDEIVGYVNGTPITGELRVERHKATKIAVFGCGLRHYVEGVSKRHCTILLNVTTPYMPITTDGKEPDFGRYLSEISTAVTRATKRLKSVIRRRENVGTQASIILDHLDDAIAQASGDGQYRYSLRQLFYAVRPHVLSSGLENTDLNYDHFARVITKYEREHGELPGIYRDPRGTLYHPHLRRSIPVGTQAVEGYERPEWTFNKVVYCEKEGFLNLLQSVGWPERHDCALLSSKGFASRAVRDLLDLLGETEEQIQFFCVHDADASGTLIYQALQHGTPSRAARKVKIINLGLEPWEALDMGLQVERFKVKGGHKLQIAEYVADHVGDEPPRGYSSWRSWLQGRRVELNAMTSPQFIEWLDGKMARFSKGKVVPPQDVLRGQLRSQVEGAMRRRLADEILREQGFDRRLEEALAERAAKLDALEGLDEAVRQGLDAKPQARWTDPLQKLADDLAKSDGRRRGRAAAGPWRAARGPT